MRTSLIETREIENYIFHASGDENRLLSEAKAIIQPQFAEKIQWQRKAYHTIQQYARLQLKNEINAVHQKLFEGPEHRSFRQNIMRLFRK